MTRSYQPNRIIIEGTLIADTPIRQTLPDLNRDKAELLPVPKTAFQLGPNMVETGLPYLTANGLRGTLRTILADQFLEHSQLSLEDFPIKPLSDDPDEDTTPGSHAKSGALKVLYAGGEAAKGSDADYNPFQLEQRRQALPTFALLGASIFGAFFKGRLMVHRGLPAIQRTQAHEARPWIIPAADYHQNPVALTYPDLDPTALTFIESMARNQRAEILGDSGKHTDTQGNDNGTGSMVFQQESILAGITFLVRWELQDFDWHRADDIIQLGALLDALTRFYHVGQFGANANTGHGRFHGALYINTDPVTRTTDTQGRLLLATEAPGFFTTTPVAWEPLMDTYAEFCATQSDAIATALAGLETTPAREFIRKITNAEKTIKNFAKTWASRCSAAIRTQTIPDNFNSSTWLDQVQLYVEVWTALQTTHQTFLDDPLAKYTTSQRHKTLGSLKTLSTYLQHDCFASLPELTDLRTAFETLQHVYEAAWAPRDPDEAQNGPE